MFVGVDLASKGPNPVSDKPTSDAIEIRLTPTQKEHYGRQTGLSLPSSLSLPLAELKLLSGVAAKAGSGSLPVSRSAVRQLLGRDPPHERGGGPFVVEVALTPGQKEQIRRATGRVFASLRVVPDDVAVTYRETWDDLTPLRVGRAVVVKPAGESHEASDADRIIELPAGDGSKQGVFGTGRHPATQLSLILLEEYVRPGDRVLDLGTGSGILAAAAAKMGAAEVLALDIDAAAAAVARETVSLNGLAGVVEVRRGGIESAAPPYDAVAANIFPNVLIELAPDLAAAVRRGGVLLTSGSVAARAEGAADAVRAAGLGLEGRRSRGDWVGMVFRRP
jgi:ribosomal protein L11 methyltransferase